MPKVTLPQAGHCSQKVVIKPKNDGKENLEVYMRELAGLFKMVAFDIAMEVAWRSGVPERNDDRLADKGLPGYREEYPASLGVLKTP